MKATIKLEHDLVAFEGDHDVHAMLEIIVPEPDVDVVPGAAGARTRDRPLRLDAR